MASLLSFPQRCPPISKSEWAECVNLALDIQEAEAILAAMKSDHAKMRAKILAKLAQGATIEDAGRIT